MAAVSAHRPAYAARLWHTLRRRAFATPLDTAISVAVFGLLAWML
jgi:hypothetical protein